MGLKTGIIFIGLKIIEILALFLLIFLIFNVGLYVADAPGEDMILSVEEIINVILYGLITILVACFAIIMIFFVIKAIFVTNWEWAKMIEKKLKKKEDKK